MNRKEFGEFLESIGGLENGYFPNRPQIKDPGFFMVGDGWLLLIKNLIEELIAIGWDRQICQVKEKFGGLRFYANDVPDGGLEIISRYEDLSYKTCETCGSTENITQTKGWITTICQTCLNKKEKK